MAHLVEMPALGESVTEGVVTTWLKQVGDVVEIDEPIVEISTDKVDSEVPSPVAGVILEILAAEDETVPVGAPLCRIGEAGEAAPAAAETPAPVAAPAPTPAPAVAEAPVAAPVATAGIEVVLPALGESVTEGVVTSWLKAIGDEVAEEEPLLEVSTDKVDSEVPSPAAGFLAEIRVQEDETASVGQVLAIITTSVPSAATPAPATSPAPAAPAPAPVAAPAAPAPVAPVAPAPVAPAPVAAPVAPAPVSEVPAPAAGIYVTPLVRKLAKEKGIDLNKLTGTGIGGRIRKEDVLEAAVKAATVAAAAPAPTAAAKPATPAIEVDTTLRGKTEKMSRLRQTIAKRMMTSLQTSAQLTTVIEVDVTRIASLRARAKKSFAEREGTNLTFLPFFVKAATEALKMHPKINATINGNEVTYYDYEHIGIAVDTPKGLFVPVVKHAGDLTLGGLAKSINDLAKRTREGKAEVSELSGSTFTITNTGSGGALFDTPVLNTPEVAILGLGTIVKRPTVVKDAEGNETIGIRSMVYLSLSYDHQLIDGADAARYLMTVKKRLEAGEFEEELGL